MDLVVGVTGLVATAPVQISGALAILIEDGRPVLFTQTRVGRGGRPFTVYKFRSMAANDLAPGAQQVGIDHPLVTRTGRVIRRLKIDELPQLVNVVAGHMSLVGPRPALPEQAAAYDDFQRTRLRVRPGLTGWAQVNGNVALTWPERILLDVWYVDHWSLRLDAAILLRTLEVILRGEHRSDETLAEARRHALGTARRG